MRSRWVVLAAASVLLFVCSCDSGGVAESVPSAPRAVADGNLRLGDEVVPRHYELDLRIEPSADRFSGRAAIRVEAAEPLARLQLHAQGLEIERAEIERRGSPPEPVAFELGENGALVLLPETPVEGAVTLHFAWQAPLGEKPFGLYRVEDGGRWYAFSQLQPLEARKVFPCFDQPSFKTPYTVTLRVPTGKQAIANGPELSRTADGGGDVVVFQETKPLPTYLVAFAVGDFDVVEGAGDGPPTRVVATRGKGRLAGFALERTPAITTWLVEYFDFPFPYAKLDLVAVPNFGAGAMENVGLVTFRERLLLLDAERAPLWSRYASQSVIAHELAHMWYGNLVTLAWWDDLWLNESFATWMAARVLEDVDPELDSRLDAISSAQRTMRLDSKRDARQIRQPIEHGGDVYNAFDGITYGKGAAVLRMLEAWLGEERFRDGVRVYMRDNAHGTGGTSELLAALEAVSGEPVSRVMAGFLDQPGTPLVEAELSCREGAAPRVRLRQTRALPAGSEASAGEAWSIPVCLALGGEDVSKARSRECFLLEQREQSFDLAFEGCPRWLHPNADERGYYRWSLPPEDWVSLLDEYGGELADAELAAIPGNAFALLEAERIEVAEVLDAMRVLADHPKRHVSGAVIDVLELIYRAGISDPESLIAAAWGKEIRSLLGPQLERIGQQPRAGEPADSRLRRSALVEALAVMGRDASVRALARETLDAFLADPGAVDEEGLATLLPIAVREADAAAWNALLEIVADPPSPVVRSTVVRSLGRFEDPALVRRSLDAVIDGRLRAQDYRSVARSISPAMRPTAWKWLTESYEKLAPRLGPMTATDLPHIASGLCSDADAERVTAFFAERPDAPAGTSHNVALVSEGIRRCARLRVSLDGVLAEALAAN